MKLAKQRFDSVQFKAHFDEHGFLVDRPVVARIGAQTYQTPFGKRVEFRPASEVFKPTSLESFAGKPVTLGHVTVTPDNAEDVVVGSCAGAGISNGIGVEVPMSIYSGRAISKAKSKEAGELSVGYTSVDIETPGWGNNKTGEYFFEDDMPEGWKADSDDWVKFDALQTEITVNHVALVFKGRAGIAKLNLDSEQELPYDTGTNSQKEKQTMTVKIKIDSAEVEVSKDVANHIEAITADLSAAQASVATITGERDALQAKVDGIDDLVKAGIEKFKADSAARAEVVKVAEAAGVKHDGVELKDLKVAAVKALNGKDVSTKSDAYIDAAFDLAAEGDAMAEQRRKVKGDAFETDKADADEVELNPNSRLAKLNK